MNRIMSFGTSMLIFIIFAFTEVAFSGNLGDVVDFDELV